MIALVMIYSPWGSVMTVPRETVTALVITCNAPVRPPRRAPASLRPAPTSAPKACDLARLIDQLPPNGPAA